MSHKKEQQNTGAPVTVEGFNHNPEGSSATASSETNANSRPEGSTANILQIVSGSGTTTQTNHHVQQQNETKSSFKEFGEKLWKSLSRIPPEKLDTKTLENLSGLLTNRTNGHHPIAQDLVNIVRYGKQDSSGSDPDNQAFERFYAYLKKLNLSDKQVEKIDKSVFTVPLNLLGQSLLLNEIQAGTEDFFSELKKQLGDGPIITNIESVIDGEGVTDIRGVKKASHIAPEGILDSLQKVLGDRTMYALAGNHASDAGEVGIIRTIEGLQKRGMVFAGIGTDDKKAISHSILTDPVTGLKIALVSAASGGLSYSEQTNTIAGVGKGAVLNAIQLENEELNEAQVERNIDAVKAAAKEADVVVFCYHDHCSNNRDESKSEAELPERLKDFSHRIIDAGANIILGHGPTVAQAKVMYHGGLIDYGAGSFIFQPRGENFPESAWDACIAKVDVMMFAGTMVLGPRTETKLTLSHDAQNPQMNGLPEVSNGQKNKNQPQSPTAFTIAG